MVVEKILRLMREQGIRSITEQNYVSSRRQGTRKPPLNPPMSDTDMLGGLEWLDRRIVEAIMWGKE